MDLPRGPVGGDPQETVEKGHTALGLAGLTDGETEARGEEQHQEEGGWALPLGPRGPWEFLGAAALQRWQEG